MTQQVQIERARKQDSRFIAEMIALASDGIARIEWQQQADNEPGRSAIDIGATNYAGDDGDYSYRNCWIARPGSGQAVGMILSFALTEENRSVDARPPPYSEDDIYAPYRYLEAVNSWYICGVAVIPEYRQQGIARVLIQQSISDGKQAGFDNTSLIAMAQKDGLIAYYQSLGFHITRRAPIVEHPQIDAHGEALLMETRHAA
jgi:ribosomal protein S18 acetylase RimI-like enzyme